MNTHLSKMGIHFTGHTIDFIGNNMHSNRGFALPDDVCHYAQNGYKVVSNLSLYSAFLAKEIAAPLKPKAADRNDMIWHRYMAVNR
jgi:hypothetical protein